MRLKSAGLPLPGEMEEDLDNEGNNNDQQQSINDTPNDENVLLPAAVDQDLTNSAAPGSPPNLSDIVEPDPYDDIDDMLDNF